MSGIPGVAQFCFWNFVHDSSVSKIYFLSSRQYLVFLIWKMFHTHRYNILCVNAVPGHIPLENWFSLILAEQLLLSSVLNLESFHAKLWRLSQVVHFKNIFYWVVNFYYFLWLIGVSFSKNVLLIHAFFTVLCPLESSSIYFAK